MFGQALDHGEVINVRWATEDPNPYGEKRKRHDEGFGEYMGKYPH